MPATVLFILYALATLVCIGFFVEIIGSGVRQYHSRDNAEATFINACELNELSAVKYWLESNMLLNESPLAFNTRENSMSERYSDRINRNKLNKMLCHALEKACERNATDVVEYLLEREDVQSAVSEYSHFGNATNGENVLIRIIENKTSREDTAEKVLNTFYIKIRENGIAGNVLKSILKQVYTVELIKSYVEKMKTLQGGYRILADDIQTACSAGVSPDSFDYLLSQAYQPDCKPAFLLALANKHQYLVKHFINKDGLHKFVTLPPRISNERKGLIDSLTSIDMNTTFRWLQIVRDIAGIQDSADNLIYIIQDVSEKVHRNVGNIELNKFVVRELLGLYEKFPHPKNYDGDSEEISILFDAYIIAGSDVKASRLLNQMEGNTLTEKVIVYAQTRVCKEWLQKSKPEALRHLLHNEIFMDIAVIDAELLELLKTKFPEGTSEHTTLMSAKQQPLTEALNQ